MTNRSPYPERRRSPRRAARAGGLLLVALWLGLVGVPSARAQDASAADEPPPLPKRPYTLRAWFHFEPSARVARDRRAIIIRDWLDLIRRFVGEPWEVRVAEDEGPLLGVGPSGLDQEEAAKVVQGIDKGWFFGVLPDERGVGYILEGREFDAATQQLGPLYRQTVRHRADVARFLLELSKRVFAPVAEIGRVEDGVALTVQGAAIPPASSFGQVAEESTILRPFWLFLEGDGSIRGIRDIPFTYLRIDSMRDGEAESRIVSGLRRPLPRQVPGRYRLLALGLNPADVPTRFRFQTVDEERPDPVAGYVVTARRLNQTRGRVVGTTDRNGRITLPPRFDDDLVMLRLLAAGVEPLREFPVLPGETTEERVVPVEPKPAAVAFEFRLLSLQDEIVDLIARRGRLEAVLSARAEGQRWDAVKELLDEYEKLPGREAMEERLRELREEAERRQAEDRVPVLTRTALAEFAETEALIERYLDVETFAAYADAYERAQAQAQGASGDDGGETDSGLRSRRLQPRDDAGSDDAPAEAKAEPKAEPKSSAPALKKRGASGSGGNTVPF